MTWERVAICNALTTRNGWFNPSTWRQDLAMTNGKSFGIGAEKIVPHHRLEILGEDVLNVLKQHGVVVTQHLATTDFYRALREPLPDGRPSRVKKVLHWFDWEAVPAAGYHSPFAKDIGAFMQSRPLVGTKPNRFNQMHVDPYELSAPHDGVGKPHCWCTDIRDESWPAAYMEYLVKMLTPYSALINGVLFDNCMPRPYYGGSTGASNAPNVAELTERFKDQCEAVLWGFRKSALGEIWGNCGAVQREYVDIDVKWGELDMGVTNPGMLAHDVTQSVVAGTAARGRRQGYVFSPQRNAFWLQSQREWDLLHAVTPVESIGVVTFRSSFGVVCPAQCG